MPGDSAPVKRSLCWNAGSRSFGSRPASHSSTAPALLDRIKKAPAPNRSLIWSAAISDLGSRATRPPSDPRTRIIHCVWVAPSLLAGRWKIPLPCPATWRGSPPVRLSP